jgi:predicted phage tail protein
LILGGVVKALTPSQKGGSGSNAQNEPSYHFNGPSNTSTQGSAVPVVYGRMIVGSMVISQGMSSEEYVNASTTPVDNSTSILPTTWMPKYVYRG